MQRGTAYTSPSRGHNTKHIIHHVLNLVSSNSGCHNSSYSVCSSVVHIRATGDERCSNLFSPFPRRQPQSGHPRCRLGVYFCAFLQYGAQRRGISVSQDKSAAPFKSSSHVTATLSFQASPHPLLKLLYIAYIACSVDLVLRIYWSY